MCSRLRYTIDFLPSKSALGACDRDKITASRSVYDFLMQSELTRRLSQETHYRFRRDFLTVSFATARARPVATFAFVGVE